MQKKFNEADVAAMKVMHDSGVSYRKMSERFGCNWQTIMLYLDPLQRERKVAKWIKWRKENPERIKEAKKRDYLKIKAKKQKHLQDVIDRYFSPKV